MKPSQPGFLTLDIMRPLFNAAVRSDRKRVQAIGARILGEIQRELKELKKQHDIIVELKRRYGGLHA